MRKVEKEVLKKKSWDELKDLTDNEIGDILEQVLKNNKLKKSMMKSLDYEDDVKLAMAIKHIKAKAIMVSENSLNATIDNKQYKIEMIDGYYNYTATELETTQTDEIKTEDTTEINMTNNTDDIKTKDNGKGSLEVYLEVYKRLALADGIVHKNMKRILETYETEVNDVWVLTDEAFDNLTDEELNELIGKLYNVLDAGKSTLGIYNVTMTVKGPELKPFIYLTEAHIDIFEHIYTYNIAFRTIFEAAFGQGITPTTVRGTLNSKDNFVRNHGSFLKLMESIKENDQSYVGLIEGDWRNIYKGKTSAIVVPKIATNDVVEPVPQIDIDVPTPVDAKPSLVVEPLSVKKEELVKEPIVNPDPITMAIETIESVDVKPAAFIDTTSEMDEMFGFLNDFGNMADGVIFKRIGFKTVDEFLTLDGVGRQAKLELFEKEKANMIAWIKESVDQYNAISARLEAGASPIEALGELYKVYGCPDINVGKPVVDPVTNINTLDIGVYNTVKQLLITNATDDLIADVVKVINDTITIGPFVAEHKELPTATTSASKYDFYRVMYIMVRTLEFLKVEGDYPTSNMLDSSPHKVVDEMLSTYEVIDDNSDTEAKIGVQDQKMFGRAKDLFRSNVPANDRKAIEEIVGFTFTQLNELDARTTKHRFKEILYAIVWGLIHNGGTQLIKEHHIYDINILVNTLEDELVSKFGKLKTEHYKVNTAAQDLLNLIMGGK